MANVNGAGAVPVPTSIEDVEQMIKTLYAGSTPSVVAGLDRQLKALQTSSEGWQMADALMRSDNDKVRFFGVLTFQVKLNNDGAKLDAETAQTVLMRLLSWTAQLSHAGETHMVLRKLSNALTTYFMRSPMSWRRPLLHLAASLQQGNAVPAEHLPNSPDALERLLQVLSERQLQSLIGLSSALATEAEKLDNAAQTTRQKQDQMLEVVEDASKVMHFASRQPLGPQSGNFKAENLSCFLNWVNYAQPLWTNSHPEALGYLRNLVTGLAAHLMDPILQHEAMDVFRDILETFTSFFQLPHMVLLAEIIYEHVRPGMLQGLQAQEPEVLPAAQMVIAYGVANVKEIVEEQYRVHGSKEVIQLLLAILEAPGYPGDDDEVSLHSIEFWNTYIEYINEARYSSDEEAQPAWLEHAKAVCMRLSMLLWSKSRTPPQEVAQDWSDAEHDAFKEFRMDAADLLLSLFILLGNEMLQQYITLILNALASEAWLDVEAGLCCINSLADNVLEDPESERLLVQVFSSPLFREIADFDKNIPSQARRTAIDTLGKYGGYIERHAEFLPDTLRFLFASLETQGFHLSASKSIDSLCSACRGSLTGELDGFITQYKQFSQSETSEPYTNQRVIGGIAAIVQAVAPESAKAQPLSALLDIVDTMVDVAKQYVAQSNHDLAHDHGVSAIDCLVRMGKSLQIPDDVPVVVLDDDEKPKDQSSFWLSETGQGIQHRILGICNTVLQSFPASGEVVDSVCGVFKSGFAETEPGPFVFPPDFCVIFLEQCTVATPRVEAVLSMVMKLLVQHSRQSSPRIDALAGRIYRKTATFIQALGQSSQDPAIAQCCIDVFYRMIPRYSNILVDVGSSGELVQPILDFTLRAIEGPDLFPKRAAAEFWTAIIKPQDVAADPAVRERSEQVFTAYGPQLVQILVNQYAGQAQRSELDQLCEPLKVLVTRPQAKSWLEAALSTEAVQRSSENVDKRRFLQTILGLRGDGRKTKEAVKRFWAACRGTVASYDIG
ncbi:ARM repeat-containing [Lecanosticta acicola]|uniref:ARM repeat-containing n=1 Tax=Lecanosticta acicola TaxID=111012 RepID=A0AAI8YW80_9PEZI|nr:ARM repeat-containing [Lecanosticta acicola]